MLIKLMLAKLGVEAVIAEDGNQAVKQALSQSFDLILMDIQMPNMNGYEATRALKEQGSKAPIVALTANALVGDDHKCLEAGCDGYLTKPIDRKELSKVLAKYLPAFLAPSSRTLGSEDAQTFKPESLDSEQGDSCIPTNEPADPAEGAINWDRLIEIMGDEDTIREIIPVYTTNIKEHFDELVPAIEDGDCASIASHAHALKGVGRNLGIKRLSDIGGQMEKAGRDNDIDVANKLLSGLKTQVDAVLMAFSRSDWIETAKMV